MNEENNLIKNIFSYKSYKTLFHLKKYLKYLDEYNDISIKILIIKFIQRLKYNIFIILLNKILLKINITKEYIIKYIELPFIINNKFTNKLLNIISLFTPYINLIIKYMNAINIIKNFIINISDEELYYIFKILILQKIDYINCKIINTKIINLLNDINIIYNNIILNIILNNNLILDDKNKIILKKILIKTIDDNKEIIYNYIYYYKKNIINYFIKNRILIAQLIPDELLEYEDELFEDDCLNFIFVLLKENLNNGIFAIILYNYIIYLLETIN